MKNAVASCHPDRGGFKGRAADPRDRLFPVSVALWRLAIAVVWMALTVQALAAQADSSRHALVIGNANYVGAGVKPLRNPVNDARAISGKLTSLGFKVTLVLDLKRDDIGETLERFSRQVNRGDAVVIFYAGHGMQVRGENYLLAVDAAPRTELDVKRNSVAVSEMLLQIEAVNPGTMLVFFDACRINPYARSIRSLTGESPGLANVVNAPSGTLVSFSTRPGRIADDGPGENSLYTKALLAYLDTPGLPVEQMLKKVARYVKRESNDRQEPWMEGNIYDTFSFNPSVSELPAGNPRPDPADLAWDYARGTRLVPVIEAFLEEHPASPHASMARLMLAELRSLPISGPALALQGPQVREPRVEGNGRDEGIWLTAPLPMPAGQFPVQKGGLAQSRLAGPQLAPADPMRRTRKAAGSDVGEEERSAWEQALAAKSRVALQRYLAVHPDGAFREAARVRLDELAKSEASFQAPGGPQASQAPPPDLPSSGEIGQAVVRRASEPLAQPAVIFVPADSPQDGKSTRPGEMLLADGMVLESAPRSPFRVRLRVNGNRLYVEEFRSDFIPSHGLPIIHFRCGVFRNYLELLPPSERHGGGRQLDATCNGTSDRPPHPRLQIRGVPSRLRITQIPPLNALPASVPASFSVRMQRK